MCFEIKSSSWTQTFGFWVFMHQNCSAWSLGGSWIFKFWATHVFTQKCGAAGEALYVEFPCKRLHLNETSRPPKTPLNIVPMTHLSGSVCDFRLWQIRGADISACLRVFISNRGRPRILNYMVSFSPWKCSSCHEKLDWFPPGANELNTETAQWHQGSTTRTRCEPS